MRDAGGRPPAGRWLLALLAVWSLGTGARAGDGVIEINQARAEEGGVTAGDAPGFPVTLSEAGSYLLTSTLTVADPNVSGIVVTTSSVTIDLNGFGLAGPVSCNGSGAGLSCSPTGTGSGIVGTIGTVVKDGTIRGFASDAVSLLGAGRITRVRTARNGGNGLSANEGTKISESSASLNFGAGIATGAGCLVSGNEVRWNRLDGIVAGAGSRIADNVVRSNAAFGLNASALGVGYTGNVFSDNNGGDSNAQVSGGTDQGANLCGTRTSCP